MSKIHYFQRYSTQENAVTNNTLQLFARIYSYSPEQASKLLQELTGEQLDIGIEINQQGRAGKSVPDGVIVQRSFKILVESKVDSPVNPDQLARHATGFGNESMKILFLLTREKISTAKVEAISKKVQTHGVIFKNVSYAEICNAISGLFKEYEFEMQALVEDYIDYCNDAGISDQSKDFMRVVPCGNSLELNRKYGMYFQPVDRGYTKHSYLGIYAGKRVQFLFPIDSVFDIRLSGSSLKKVLVQGRQTDDYDQKIIDMVRDAKRVCGYEVGSGHRFFCGSQMYETNFAKKSFGGIFGARIFNLKTLLGSFKDAKDVAAKLNGKQWE